VVRLPFGARQREDRTLAEIPSPPPSPIQFGAPRSAPPPLAI